MPTLTAKRATATRKPVTRRTVKSSLATSPVLSHTFSDGTTVKGSFEKIEKVATALGLKITGLSKVPAGYYMSESKGLVKLSAMNEMHLRRALLKQSKDYYSNMFSTADSNKEFMRKYTALANDPTVISLFTELAKRG